jgi:N-methylhydantoinase A
VKERRYALGVDVGGTFTDVVVATPDGGLVARKVATTVPDQSLGVLNGLERIAADLATDVEQLLAAADRFVHGSTVAANALLEHRGARSAFVTTKGFRDAMVMRRMFRENMYDLASRPPEPLIPRDRILEVDERVTWTGEVLTPLCDDEIECVVDRLACLQVESVGISLLYAFRNPDHERRLGDAIARRLPDCAISLSSDIAPEIRDYERASTTVVNTFLKPEVERYLRRLDDQLQARGLDQPLQVMQSNGGVTDAATAGNRAVTTLLSGPAAGVIGSVHLGEAISERNLISLDVGGTSCDISVISNGKATSSTYLSTNARFEGWDVLTPYIDIRALGAGGGSVAWIDRAGGLHVGPRSAGARPGPASYGLGGEEPTVTDAAVVLGYVNPEFFLGGEMRLDPEKAAAAVGTIASELGIDLLTAAWGIFEIVNTRMSEGIRLTTVSMGADPRDFALLCFGGAGPVHGTALMQSLGIERAIVPGLASVFSAFGLLASDSQVDGVLTVYRPLADCGHADLEQGFAALERDVRDRLAGTGVPEAAIRCQHMADVRYLGQTHELRVNLDGDLSPAAVQRAFETAYRDTYGYLNDVAPPQIVNLRVSAVGAWDRPEFPVPPSASGTGSVGVRPAYFPELSGLADTPILREGSLGLGESAPGPAIVELPTTTIVVRPSQRLDVDALGNFIVTMETVA